jgi:DNA polymerase IIIc chi subunit
MMFAIVAVCLAAIHLAFDESQRRQVKRGYMNLIASMKKERRGRLPVKFWRLSPIEFAIHMTVGEQPGKLNPTGLPRSPNTIQQNRD